MQKGAYLAAFLLAGCAAGPQVMRFTKPGATMEQFMAVRYECLEDASRGAQTVSARVGAITMSRSIPSCARLASCLAASGYVLDPKGELTPPPGTVVRCAP